MEIGDWHCIKQMYEAPLHPLISCKYILDAIAIKETTFSKKETEVKI